MCPTPNEQPQLNAYVRSEIGKELRNVCEIPANPSDALNCLEDHPALIEFCERFGRDARYWGGYPPGKELGLPQNHYDWRNAWNSWTCNPAGYPAMCLAFFGHALTHCSHLMEVQLFLLEHFATSSSEVMIAAMQQRLRYLDAPTPMLCA